MGGHCLPNAISPEPPGWWFMPDGGSPDVDLENFILSQLSIIRCNLRSNAPERGLARRPYYYRSACSLARELRQQVPRGTDAISNYPLTF